MLVVVVVSQQALLLVAWPCALSVVAQAWRCLLMLTILVVAVVVYSYSLLPVVAREAAQLLVLRVAVVAVGLVLVDLSGLTADGLLAHALDLLCLPRWQAAELGKLGEVRCEPGRAQAAGNNSALAARHSRGNREPVPTAAEAAVAPPTATGDNIAAPGCADRAYARYARNRRAPKTIANGDLAVAVVVVAAIATNVASKQAAVLPAEAAAGETSPTSSVRPSPEKHCGVTSPHLARSSAGGYSS